MNQVAVFQNGTWSIRAIEHNGEPWFVAADVCRALDVGNNRDAVGRLDEDEKGVGSIDTPGGPQKMTIVSEAGLYGLILGSRKPEAHDFKRWVTHEVLPAIRKTGQYSLDTFEGRKILPPRRLSGAMVNSFLRVFGKVEAGKRVDHIIGYVPRPVVPAVIYRDREPRLTTEQLEAEFHEIMEGVRSETSAGVERIAKVIAEKKASKKFQESLNFKLDFGGVQ